MIDIIKNVFEKTKNVMSKILVFFKKHKIVTMLITMLLTLCIGLVGNCGGESSARSPTKVYAYSTVGEGANYFHIDLESYIAIRTEDGTSVENIYLKGLWLDKVNGRFLFPTSEIAYDSISLLDNSIKNATLVYSLSNVNENVGYIDCEITASSFSLEQLQEVNYMRFQNGLNYCRLHFYTTFTVNTNSTIGYIQFNFGRQIGSVPSAILNLSGIPPTLSYSVGYEEGRRIGYNEGVDTTWGDVSPFEVISNSIDDLFDTPLFGSTLKIKHVLQIGFGIILLGFIIKVFLGG